MSNIKQLTKIEIGGSEHGIGFEVERVIESDQPALSITVFHASVGTGSPDADETIIHLKKEGLILFCASLLNLLPAFSRSQYNLQGGWLFALPSQPLFLDDDGYTAHLFFFEDSVENLEKQNSYFIKEDLLLRDISDQWGDIHNKSISTISITPAERSELTAFALRCLGESWGVTVAEVMNILPKSFRALSQQN